MSIKRKIAQRGRNSRKANAKKESAVIVSHRKASVKEVIGLMISVFGMALFFGKWSEPAVQAAWLAVATVLMFGGVFVALGGKE